MFPLQDWIDSEYGTNILNNVAGRLLRRNRAQVLRYYESLYGKAINGQDEYGEEFSEKAESSENFLWEFIRWDFCAFLALRIKKIPARVWLENDPGRLRELVSASQIKKSWVIWRELMVKKEAGEQVKSLASFYANYMTDRLRETDPALRIRKRLVGLLGEAGALRRNDSKNNTVISFSFAPDPRNIQITEDDTEEIIPPPGQWQGMGKELSGKDLLMLAKCFWEGLRNMFEEPVWAPVEHFLAWVFKYAPQTELVKLPASTEDEDTPDPIDNLECPDDSGRGFYARPEQAIEEEETALLAEKALYLLREKQQLAIHLHNNEALSFEEVARLGGWSGPSGPKEAEKAALAKIRSFREALSEQDRPDEWFFTRQILKILKNRFPGPYIPL